MMKGKHRTARGAARLRSLKDTAADMFLELGYDSVSLDTLIARVGGSRRNIYGCFGSKEGLFVEVVTQLCADLQRPLRELKIGLADERTALTQFGESVLGFVLQPRALALHRLMIAEGARASTVAQAIYKAGPDNAASILSVWIASRQTTGYLRGDFAPRELADKFMELLVPGPLLRALVGLDATTPLSDIDRAECTRNAVEIFLNGAQIGIGEAGARDCRR
jgi:AcrR family transcriptional regulator